MADGPRVGDELPPVERDQLVDAEPGARGDGDEEVVPGVIIGVGDAKDGVDVGAGGDAGRGTEVAGHAPSTWREGRSEQRLLGGRRGSRASAYEWRRTSSRSAVTTSEGELRVCRSGAENRSANVGVAVVVAFGGGSRTR